jgi:hypothetical protein
MDKAADVTALVQEYRVLLEDVDAEARGSLECALTHEAEWTPEAAAHLVELARAYGSFMLRNALAIALALEIEDGELGF